MPPTPKPADAGPDTSAAPEAVAPVAEAATPVKDSLDLSVSEQFTVDQMYDMLERARIEAQGRTDDPTIRFGAEEVEVAGAENEPDVWANRFFVSRNGHETLHGLTVDEAKVALDAIGA